MSAKQGWLILVGVGLLASVAAMPATAERLYDRDVAKLIDDANKGLGKFMGNMKGDAKGAKVTREGVEVDVSDFLADLKEEGGKLDERFAADGMAAQNALAFLQKAKTLDGFLGRHPGWSGADKEWEMLRPALVSLGGAYQIDWNADPASWRPVRTGDAQIMGWASGLDAQIKAFGGGMSTAAKQAKLDAGARKALDGQIKALTGGAKTLQKALKSSAPAGAALQSLAGSYQAALDKASSLGLGDAATSAGAPLKETFAKLSGALGA